MNKFLRFSLLSLLAIFSASAFAEDVLWSEDWADWDVKTNPNGINANYTFTGTVLNDDGSYKSGTAVYNEKLAGGTAPELMIAKNGGSFTAKIALGGKSGELTLQFKANFKNNKSTLDITAEGATVGEQAVEGSDVTVPVTVNAGATEISITFTTNTTANVRFDDAKLYQGTAKKPAGLSWGTASRTVTLGAEDNNFPTLTNANELPVTYSSSETTVATINTTGEITLVAAGKTTITATFAGNDEFEAGEVSYELTVKEGSQEPDPVDPTDKGTVDNPYTVAEAQALLATMDANVKSQEVYISGVVGEITEVSLNNGNATFAISDNPIASDVQPLLVFRAKYLEKKNFTSEDQIQDGDEVIICGQLVNYKSSKATETDPVTPEITGGYVYSLNGKTKDETPEPVGPGSKDEPYSVAEALAEIDALADGAKSTNDVYVKGKVVAISELSTQYGNATFEIADEAAAAKGVKRAESASTITVFRAKYLENTNFTAEDQLKVGDEVVVTGKLQKYVKDGVTTPEIASGGYVYSLNGETVNGISTVKAAAQLNGNAPIYNLAGQKVSAQYKGIVIQNGKKFINK